MARILIDGRVLAHPQMSGVERYVTELSRRLVQHRNFNRFDIVQPATRNKFGQHWWQHVSLPLRAKRDRCAALFCPANIAPLIVPRSVRLVLTMHGLAFRYSPESYSKGFVAYYSMLVPRSLRRADAIIAVSQAEKHSILEHYPWVAAGKIHVVPSGIDHQAFQIGEKSVSRGLLQQRFQLAGDFVLAVGSFQALKNFPKLIEGYNRVATRIGAKLVLVTSRGIPPAQVNPNVVVLTADGADMPHFYRVAKAFVCPSAYEGFGFPVLEAMACGCPVIASTAGALPEICGDAAFAVNEIEPQALADALVRLLTDDALRQTLIERGLNRVKSFTWERTVRETVGVFDALLGERER